MPEKGCRSAPLGERAIAILVWLTEHEPATPQEIGEACGSDLASMRGRLVMLGRQGFVEGRPNGAKPPRTAYRVTAEGRRAAGIGDTRRTGA